MSDSSGSHISTATHDKTEPTPSRDDVASITENIELSAEELVGELIKAWREAENLLKRAERSWMNVVIPTVNELRYAGTHVIDALERKKNGARSIIQAIGHCHRGSYDSIELLIQSRLDQSDAVLKRIETSDVQVDDIKVPGFDYWAVRDAVEAAQGLMQDRSASVKARNDDDHVRPDLDREFLERALASLASLEKHTTAVPRVHEVLKKKQDALKRADSRVRKAWTVSVIAVVVAAVACMGTWTNAMKSSSGSPSEPSFDKLDASP